MMLAANRREHVRFDEVGERKDEGLRIRRTNHRAEFLLAGKPGTQGRFGDAEVVRRLGNGVRRDFAAVSLIEGRQGYNGLVDRCIIRRILRPPNQASARAPPFCASAASLGKSEVLKSVLTCLYFSSSVFLPPCSRSTTARMPTIW